METIDRGSGDEISRNDEQPHGQVPLEMDESQKISKEVNEGKQDRKLLRRRVILTCIYYCSFIFLGLLLGMAGPTLPDLSKNVDTSLEQVGLIFTARGSGWIIGSVLGVKAFEKINGHKLLSGAIVWVSIMMSVVPFAKSLGALLAIYALMSLGGSWIETGGNSLLLCLWTEKDKIGPLLMGLHFCIGFGASVAPFIVGILSKTFPNYSSGLWIYWIIPITCVWIAFPLLYLPSPPSPVQETEDAEDQLSDSKQSKRSYRTPIIISLVTFYLALYVGAESTFGGWIFTYAEQEYSFEESDAAFIASMFWIALTGGRLLAVPISSRVSIGKILFIAQLATVVSLVILFILASFQQNAVLWVFTIAFGISMASLYTMIFSLPTHLNVLLDGKLTSVLMVGVSLGDMLIPMAVGWLMDVVGPNALMLSLSILFIPAFVLYGILLYGCSPPQSETQKTNQQEDQESELQRNSNTFIELEPTDQGQ